MYDKNIDIWGCGVILYQMVFGKHPFQINYSKNIIDNMEQLMAIMQSMDVARLIEHEHLNISKELKEVFASIFQPSRDQRIGFAFLMKTDWLNEAQIRFNRSINSE